MDCALSLLESHADSSLGSVDPQFARELQSGIMTPDQVLLLLDFHDSRTFPHTWKTVARSRRQLAHRIPVSRKQIRQANYAAIQTLYHQRRKDAASVNDSAFGKIVRNLSVQIRVHGAYVNAKEELVATWSDSLHNSVDGRGLRECCLRVMPDVLVIIGLQGISQNVSIA
ncbi:hypothetical protein CLF_106029 [Clonorchis sinensis]|uniref:Uncharacterized protein n=1 Tax=Clonorchis sinensis TaxID=79923 RepID=G7YEL1_CLOSI|nr:hypothetical protein CLF_106029 [Clonorchis sinensis]